MFPPIPCLKTPKDCQLLAARLHGAQVVALWATGFPLQTVDVMLYFRAQLRKRGKTVLFLARESALPALAEQADPHDPALFYQLDDVALLEHCPFIAVLFCHDYTAELRKAARSPVGKIVIFPHAFKYPVPGEGICWADYVVAHNKKPASFDFSRFPDSVKKFRATTLTVIPAGYPKLDLLIDARLKAGAGVHRRAIFLPILRTWNAYVPDAILARELILLAQGLFQRLPDWQFVLRPMPQDREDAAFRAVHAHFAADPRFIYDTGRDNNSYLIRSDIMITDQSAGEFNFAYATLCPVIRLRIGDASVPSPFRAGARGYWVNSAQGALAALEDARARAGEWQRAIEAERAEELNHPGQCCAYLAAAVDDLLADRIAPDWRIIDKGNTRYDRVSEYLRLLKEPLHAWHSFTPNVLTWAVEQHGKNKSIGMAALSACVRSWAGYHAVGDWLHLRNQIEWALTFVPLAQAARLFGHLARKRPQEAAAWLWQAEALTRLEPQAPLPGELQRRLCAAQPDLILCANAVMLQILRGNDPAAALARLQELQPDFSASLPEHVLAVYCLALLFNGHLDRAKKCFAVWLSVKTADWWAEELRFCAALLQCMQEGRPCPRWGTAGPATLHCLGLPLSFADEEQAGAFRKKFPEPRTAAGWPFTGFYRPQSRARS